MNIFANLLVAVCTQMIGLSMMRLMVSCIITCYSSFVIQCLSQKLAVYYWSSEVTVSDSYGCYSLFLKVSCHLQFGTDYLSGSGAGLGSSVECMPDW